MTSKSKFYKGILPTIVIVLSIVFFFGFANTVTAAKKMVKAKPGAVASAQKGLALNQAKQIAITKIYKGKIGNRALFANPAFKQSGTRIASWRDPNKLIVNKDSWFFFVDEQPGANWEHKASYILVDKTTGAVRNVRATTPPLEMLKLKPLNPKAVAQLKILKQNVQILRQKIIVKPIRILKKKKYAVLLSGGHDAYYNYQRYWNDLQFIFKALKEKYGYTDSEIIVLYANGTHSPNGDFDGNGTNDIDYAATKANLTQVINNVAINIASNGKFFFYSTNHGGDESGAHNVNLTLWGESILDSEFANLTKKIKCDEAIYVMEQCHSGGMMDNLLNAQPRPCTNPRVCVMTAARHDESSWSCDTEGQYDEYVYHWTSAVYGKTPGGTSVNADTNGDGAVSMSEAHEYAKKKDSRNEHPQIGSCVTGACNTTLAIATPIKDDCIGFNPGSATVKKINGRWKIVDGSHQMFEFGKEKNEAIKSLKIIKYYKMNQSCFVGRPKVSFKYLLVNGRTPSGSMKGEDCVSFNPKTTGVKRVQGIWKIVDGSHWIFDFGSNESEARKAMQIIKKHGFTRSCYVGRPGPSFTYLRK